LAVGRQVFRSHLVQTSEHLDQRSIPAWTQTSCTAEL